MKLKYLALLLSAAVSAPSLVMAADASCSSPSTVSGSLAATTPTARFEGVGNADLSQATIVKDKSTGLMWTACPVGFQVGSLGCYKPDDAVTAFTLEDAIAETENSSFGDFTDWRLPNVKELATIVERKCSNPALNRDVFSGSGSFMSAAVWTNTPAVFASPEEAFVVQMYYGSVTSLPVTGTAQVRMVRTAP